MMTAMEKRPENVLVLLDSYDALVSALSSKQCTYHFATQASSNDITVAVLLRQGQISAVCDNDTTDTIIQRLEPVVHHAMAYNQGSLAVSFPLYLQRAM